METMIVVGVDGGATKTSAVVLKIDDTQSAQPTRSVVGRSVGTSTNRNSVGNATAIATMHDVITQALKVIVSIPPPSNCWIKLSDTD